MVRLRAPCQAHIANRTLSYFSRRAVQFTASGHNAIAADYVIRGLMIRRRDSTLLALGEQLGTAVGHPELTERCRDAQRHMWRDPPLDVVVPTLSDTERLTTSTVDCDSINTVLRGLLGPGDPCLQCAVVGGFGRGLIANVELPKGRPVIAEKASFVHRRSHRFCSQCLTPLDTRGAASVRCDGRGCTETYCSPSCREQAFVEGHEHFCQNEAMNHIVASLQRDVASVQENGQGRADASVALQALVTLRILQRAAVLHLHPLELVEVRELSGSVSYNPRTALDETGALVVQLGEALQQPYLVLEDFMTLFGKVQMNEFLSPEGSAIYRCLSMLNHSCMPNAEVTRTESGHAVLTPVVDIPRGQQLLIDYSASAMQAMPYAMRAQLLSQRHFECFCPKCIRRQ